MQKHVNLVDFVQIFPTSIFLQKLASIQPRTSHLTFAKKKELIQKVRRGATTGDRRSFDVELAASALLTFCVIPGQTLALLQFTPNDAGDLEAYYHWRDSEHTFFQTDLHKICREILAYFSHFSEI